MFLNKVVNIKLNENKFAHCRVTHLTIFSVYFFSPFHNSYFSFSESVFTVCPFFLYVYTITLLSIPFTIFSLHSFNVRSISHPTPSTSTSKMYFYRFQLR
jgi:hypothetical protein